MCLYLGPESDTHGATMGAMMLALVPGAIFTKIHRWAKRYVQDDAGVCKPRDQRPGTETAAFNVMLSLATLLWATSTQNGAPLASLEDHRQQNAAIDRELVPWLLRILTDDFKFTGAIEDEVNWPMLVQLNW